MIISSDSASADLDALADFGVETEIRAFEIDAKMHGSRLDVALVGLVPELSRSYLRQLIEAGSVYVEGSPALKPSGRVKVGMRGTVEIRPTPQTQAFKPELIPLTIVYSDDHLLVINKPAGLVVHPAPGNWSGTLLNGLLGRDEKAAELPRAGIVHRLDKNTSGLMVVARTRLVMDSLVHLIAARQVSREYLALTRRDWTGPRHVDVEAPVGRDPRNRLRMAVVDLSRNVGKAAKTSVDVLDTNSLGTLVKCKLHTGRTHQIRVHMASMGFPLVADDLYGGAEGAGMARQALHAWRLAFRHPISQTDLKFCAPVPADLEGALRLLGLRYNLTDC